MIVQNCSDDRLVVTGSPNCFSHYVRRLEDVLYCHTGVAQSDFRPVGAWYMNNANDLPLMNILLGWNKDIQIRETGGNKLILKAVFFFSLEYHFTESSCL